MNKIFEKAKELGNAVADTVKEGVDDAKEALVTNEAFLVESFDTPDLMQERLNDLLENFKEVNVQSFIYAGEYIVVIKVKG